MTNSIEQDRGRFNLVVDHIRHGEPIYSGNNDSEGNLTPNGEQQIRDSVKEIVGRINKNYEVVVIWASIRGRTQQSKEICEKILSENGIAPLKVSSIKSLTDSSISRDSSLSHDRKIRVIAHLDSLARNVHPEQGKSLHMILIGHDDNIGHLLEDAFSTGESPVTRQRHAEVAGLGFTTIDDNNSQITFFYRNYSPKTLIFGRRERKIFKPE